MPVQVVDSVNCPNCSAPLPLEQGMAVIVCKYCSSAIAMDGKAKFYLKHSMIPTKVNLDDARRLLHSWMDGGFYKPPDLAKRSSIQRLECTYMPFYVFSIKARLSFNGTLTRTGKSEQKSGTLDKELIWKVLARRGSKFPTIEYKIPIESKIPFDIAVMPKDANFLNAEIDEDEAKGLCKSQVHSHMMHLAETEVDEFNQSSTECTFATAEFVHGPIWRAVYEYCGAFYKIYLDAATGEFIRAEVPPPDTSLSGLIRSVARDSI